MRPFGPLRSTSGCFLRPAQAHPGSAENQRPAGDRGFGMAPPLRVAAGADEGK